MLAQEALPLELVEVAERALLTERQADRRSRLEPAARAGHRLVRRSACSCAGVMSARLTTTLLSRSPSMRR
jgi:hypothetical protein